MIVISDDESKVGYLEGLSELLISCGDLPDHTILDAATRYGSSNVFAVKGNHDSSAPFPTPIIDLHLETRKLGELRFGGFNGCWKYKPAGNYLYEQREVTAIMKHFPPVDVFVAHNSPRGIHDTDDEVHFGFEAFNDYIETHQPSLFIHGHQHVDVETRIGSTRVVGVFGEKRVDWQHKET